MTPEINRDSANQRRSDTIRLTTASSFPDQDIAESLGIVRGNTVRARNIGRDITQALRNIIGGELKAYSTLMSDTRDQALERMVEEAAELDADGVVNLRFETAKITGSGAELLAYGTAVRFE